MTARDTHMNGLLRREELAMAKSSSPGATSGWRLPKRWLLLLTVSLALLTTIYLFNGSEALSYRDSHDRPATSQKESPSFSLSQSLAPLSYLLGSNEDTSKLWFPPSNSSEQFHPAVASHNLPPPVSERLRTPVFVAFTRNSAMLQQVLLSYIAAGWPREDIIVVDNSGTMDANPQSHLSPSSSFYLDYDRIRNRYGVSILQTPVLLTFAQLQNFFLRTAMAHDWRYFFWSHMDIAILADETASPYTSFYARVLEILSNLGITSLTATITRNDSDKWAIKYFTYDWLTLVNVDIWRTIGAWDTFIPYYTPDCDAYSRIVMNGFTKGDVRAGKIFDLPSAIANPEEKFFPSSRDEKPDSARYRALIKVLTDLEAQKPESHRNSWQDAQGQGGRADPWTHDPEGFQTMWWARAEKGRDMYHLKWGTMECRLDEHGYRLEDAWKSAN